MGRSHKGEVLIKFLTAEKAWIISHLVWVVAVAVAYVGFTNWRYAHDEAAAKAAQVQVAQATIANLQAQIAANDKQAAQKVQTIVKIVHDAQTPAQVVAALPNFPDLPSLSARTIPGDPVDVEVAAQPLMNLIGQYETVVTNLNACQADDTAEKAIVVQKDNEIVVLKKKPPLKARLVRAMKVGGTILGIGILIGLHF